MLDKIDSATIDSLTTLGLCDVKNNNYEMTAVDTNIVSDDLKIVIPKDGKYMVEFTGRFLSRLEGGSGITLYIFVDDYQASIGQDVFTRDSSISSAFMLKTMLELTQGQTVKWGYWQNTGDTSRIIAGRALSAIKVE